MGHDLSPAATPTPSRGVAPAALPVAPGSDGAPRPTDANGNAERAPGRGLGRYLVSLPERLVRAGTALAGGTLREASDVALPLAVRRSKLYQATVARVLRIAIELVGGVQGVYPAEAMPVKELTARKAAGNAVELASVVAVGWSPLWLLAAASDLMGGSKVYLRALVAELEAGGLLPTGTDVASYEDLLTRLETGSGVLADAVDVPPLRLTEARAAVAALRRQAADLPDADDLAAIFAGLQATARREGRSLAEVSAAVGLGALRAGVSVGNAYVFEYYRGALRTIADEGLLAFLRRIVAPYAKRAVGHFDPAVPTQTERLLNWARRRSRQGGSIRQS